MYLPNFKAQKVNQDNWKSENMKDMRDTLHKV